MLFGNTEWMEQNQESVQVLLEEILKVWQSIVENPEFVVEERERLGCCPTCRPSSRRSCCPTTSRRRGGSLHQDCGGEAAAKEDFEFYGAAGQLEGDPADLKVEDFWNLEPAESASSAGRGIGAGADGGRVPPRPRRRRGPPAGVAG